MTVSTIEGEDDCIDTVVYDPPPVRNPERRSTMPELPMLHFHVSRMLSGLETLRIDLQAIAPTTAEAEMRLERMLSHAREVLKEERSRGKGGSV